jgi:DNA-binding response OmpR family regulator
MSGTILLLEEDIVFSETLTEFLTEQGFFVIQAFDALVAKEMLSKLEVDLILVNTNFLILYSLSYLYSKKILPSILIGSLVFSQKSEKNVLHGQYMPRPFTLQTLLAFIFKTLNITKENRVDGI